jgi:hypothetical protein
LFTFRVGGCIGVPAQRIAPTVFVRAHASWDNAERDVSDRTVT